MKNKLRRLMLLLVMSSSSVFAGYTSPFDSQPETFEEDVQDNTPAQQPAAPIDDYVLPMLALGIAFGAIAFNKSRKRQNA